MSKLLVANWKMNGDKYLIDTFYLKLKEIDIFHKFVLCPPFTLLDYARIKIAKSKVSIGAQNCSEFKNGAHTGEISCSLLKELGCEFVIIAHSERRANNLEKEELITQKAVLALEAGITPIICIGETREEYETNKTQEKLKKQLSYIDKEILDLVIIAYEPIWAIGTGKVPTLDGIKEIHNFIKEESGKIALYGGSVSITNYKPIIEMSDVGGVLVGGESLKPACFLQMLCNQ